MRIIKVILPLQLIAQFLGNVIVNAFAQVVRVQAGGAMAPKEQRHDPEDKQSREQTRILSGILVLRLLRIVHVAPNAYVEAAIVRLSA